MTILIRFVTLAKIIKYYHSCIIIFVWVYIHALSYCILPHLSGKEVNRKGNPCGPAAVLKWILANTQAKITEFFDNIAKIVSMLFHPQSDEDKPDLYSDAVKVSFMLSVFVFIVVAVARTKWAQQPVDFKFQCFHGLFSYGAGAHHLVSVV